MPMSMMVMLASNAAMAMPASLRLRLVRRIRPITFENFLDMRASLTIGWNAAVTPHGVGPGVVRSQGELQIAVELLDQGVQIASARVQVLRGIEGVRHAQ